MRRRLGCAVFALVAVLLACPAFAQTLTVQQVEAFEDPPANTHYAPVDFHNTTTTTTGAYPGITFNAQANISTGTFTTVSGHAVLVANEFFGSGTVGQPFIANVYNNTAGNFIGGVNTMANLGLNTRSTLAAGQTLPNGFGNGIKISNHSYVGDFGNATADENAIRRVDYIVNNEDIVLAAGAATGVDAFVNQNLIWTARNALSVRGDSTNTPFDPSAAANSITAGKRRADVWSDSEASFATGRISGYAAGLIGQANALTLTNATHNQVVRSLIMTGANKAAVGSTTGAWTRDTANNLSTTLGAGKANYTESLSILQSGERTLQAVSGPLGSQTTPNVSTNSLKGFAYGPSTTGDQAIVFNAPNGITKLTATLNWNVTQATSGGTIDTSDAGRIFPNLSLELRTATLSGGQFQIGASAPPQTGLSSNAALDNAEHLYFDGTASGNLFAGMYAFIIHGDPSLTTNIGFSYDVVAVPEPAGLTILATAGLLLARRRRNPA